ncbi:MAG: hypothetical protein LBD68_08810 [Zoogloeaceae bacterium]|jgi:hypothetical protein|nr:hypothetical protein [Zoogloeaceae bacterium]
MSTPIIEQQIYLLERYSSREYFGLMRDAFKAMVKAGYAALDEFMQNLPRHYRKLPVFKQPDIVWGGRVLPNLARTDKHLDEAWRRLEAGDFSALGVASDLRTDMIGSGEYASDWMPESFRTEYERNRQFVSMLYVDITGMLYGGSFGDLYYPTWKEEKEEMWESRWGIFPPPPTWPIYRLNRDAQVSTGERTKRTGIYLPAVDKSCPCLLIACADEENVIGEAPEAYVGENDDLQATVWTLVERVADEGGPVPGQEPWREDAPATSTRA